MEIIRIKNWEKFQHYKDRKPPWIKLHVSLINDRAFMMLSPSSKCLLMLLWILASESKDGEVKYDIDDLRFRLHWNDLSDKDVKLLISKGFIKLYSGDASNMLADASKALANASNMLADASGCKQMIQNSPPETETETETETNTPLTPQEGESADADCEVSHEEQQTKTRKRKPVVSQSQQDDWFHEFWKEYPRCERKRGRTQALDRFCKHVTSQGIFDKLMQALALDADSDQWNRDGGQFIPEPSVWLNKKRWMDDLEDCEGEDDDKPDTVPYECAADPEVRADLERMRRAYYQ